jgi:hypothetical protein
MSTDGQSTHMNATSWIGKRFGVDQDRRVYGAGERVVMRMQVP